MIERRANYTLPDGNGATVAWRVQTKKTNAEDAVWQNKVKQMLIEKGVQSPVPQPTQRPDRVRE